MKISLLRIFFIVVLFASLAIRQQSIEIRKSLTADFDMSAEISALLAGQGLTLRENPVRPPRVLSTVVYFEVPRCKAASVAMPFNLNIVAQARLNRVVDPGYQNRYYYIDRTWNSQNRVKLFLTYLKHSALSVIDATPYLPVNQALVISTPAECVQDLDIDWQQIWFVRENETRFDGMAFSPDGHLIATANKDGTLKVFHAADGKVKYALSFTA